MMALPGDRVLVKERRAGEGDREVVIIEVWSEHGRPPYVVRWHDGSRKIFFPASADTLIAGGLNRGAALSRGPAGRGRGAQGEEPSA
jgi:Domain of unknown function (DUF1918)